MKKRIKLIGLLFASVGVFVTMNSFNLKTEPGGSGSKWSTTACSKVNSNGTTSYGSGCDTPDEQGPCDRKKSCTYAPE